MGHAGFGDRRIQIDKVSNRPAGGVHDGRGKTAQGMSDEYYVVRRAGQRPDNGIGVVRQPGPGVVAR